MSVIKAAIQKEITKFNTKSTHNAAWIEFNASIAKDLSLLLQQADQIGEEKTTERFYALTSADSRSKRLAEIKEKQAEKISKLEIGSEVVYHEKKYTYQGKSKSGLLILYTLDGRFYCNQAQPSKVELA